ncbi:EAL domain-containing protein [Massilia solisilvae]|uniref:EAL domain-containing protein n=1 Tax=Massilia solisilvae TaxID=1811225 RepID=A0ABT2BDQ9_9BURK|nr:EAL domain-containing protein [Massilia solisilvae]MCS0606655.1 EAL domain-containing protein [Massilia solisilvae]
MSPSVLLSQLVNAADNLPPGNESLQALLAAIREHLGMDVAFFARFEQGRRVFRMADAAGDTPVKPGASDPLEETYCQRIVDGRLPELLRDAAANPESGALPITGQLGIGAYIGVPVTLSSGEVYGTFCCFRAHADPTLSERDLGMMRVFATMAARQVEHEEGAQREEREIVNRIESVLASDALSIVYQPIYQIGQHRIAGFESLSRFAFGPRKGPDRWFGDAARVGMEVELETAAIRHALKGRERLPEDVYLSINASPGVIVSGAIEHELRDVPAHGVVLEITEHALIENYDRIIEALKPLRERGIRIAVDDAGSGYSSFRHILHLDPDIIKLDMSLTSKIDTDPARRALAAAMAGFSEETGMTIVAEGVETPSELEELKRIGIPLAQGYLLGKPMGIDEVVSLCESETCA